LIQQEKALELPFDSGRIGSHNIYFEAMIYVDKLRKCKPNRKWPWFWSCHLTADSLRELHAFAKRLGLRRIWFQERRSHYDLTEGMRNRALGLGAKEMDHGFGTR